MTPPQIATKALQLDYQPIPLEIVAQPEAPMGEVIQLRQTIEFRSLQAALKHLGSLREITSKNTLEDVAGKKLPAKFLLEANDVHEAAKVAVDLNLGIIVIGALTSGTNNFGPNKHYPGLSGILAIKPKGPIQEAPQITEPHEAIANKTDQIVIHPDKTVTVGAGLTIAQINATLAREIGPQFYIPLDLTTIDQALIGAVYATGAMGPSRIRPHEVIKSLQMTDGQEVRTLSGQELQDHEGLVGLTGGVTEITFQIFERPKNRFGFATPLKNSSEKGWTNQAAAVLAKLYPYANFRFENNRIVSDWDKGFVDGIEIITAEDLKLIIDNSNSTEMVTLAKHRMQELKAAKSDYMLYITGNSELNIDQMIDDQNPNILHALIDLEESGQIASPATFEGTATLEEMRLLREMVPTLAKEDAKRPNTPEGHVASKSTDINSRIDPEIAATLSPEQLRKLFHTLLQPYATFENDLDELTTRAAAQGVEVQVFRYGHLHPHSLDPHTRATIKTPAEHGFTHGRMAQTATTLSRELAKNCLALQNDTRLQIQAGEKGKVPNPKILDPTTRAMSAVLVHNAPPQWNFRA